MKIFLFTLGALLLGIMSGIFFQQFTQSIAFIGQLYVQFVKILGIPLISFSLIVGIIESQKIQYSIIIRLLQSSLLLTFIGLISAYFISYIIFNIHIDSLEIANIHNSSLNYSHIKEASFVNFANLVVLTVILSISFAVTIKFYKKDYLIHNNLALLYKWLLKLINITLVISPLAILSLVSFAMLNSNIEILLLVARILVIIIISYLLYYMIVYIFLKNKINKTISTFIKDSLDYQIAAFVSGSSKIGLPKALKFLDKYTIKNNATYKFILPLAATFNMQGLAIYMIVVSLAILFTFVGMPSLSQIITITLFSTIGGIGVAGISGGALVIFPSLLMALGIDEQYVVIIYLIEPLASGIRSATNLTSDVLITLNVNNFQGEKNEITRNT